MVEPIARSLLMRGPEEVAAPAKEALGEPLTAGSQIEWWISVFLFSLVLIGMVVSFTIPFETSQRVAGETTTAGGLTVLRAPQPGYVTDVWVKDGQLLQREEAILRISLDQALAGNQTRSGLRRAALAGQEGALDDSGVATRGRYQAESRDAAVQIESLSQQIQQIDQEAEFRRKQLDIAESTLARMAPAAKSGFVAKVRIEQYENAVLEARAAVSQLAQQRVALQRQLGQARESQRRLLAEHALAVAEQAEARAALLSRQAEDLSSDGVVVRAERPGAITAIRAHPGEQVQAGDTLAVVVPRDVPFEVELRADARLLPYISQGMIVSLEFDAYPADQFGRVRATVVQVSGAPVSTGQNSASSFYPVRVRLAAKTIQARGRQWPIVPGMSATAVVPTERKTLFEMLTAKLRERPSTPPSSAEHR